jgi:YHS domain-containing protein
MKPRGSFGILLAVGGFALAAGPSAPIAAQDPKVVVNTSKGGIAVQGYDPVSYFTSPAPQRGNPSFTATHMGARYHFVSAANRDRFRADPDKYAPQFGGYCGYGASRGYLAPVDPEAFTIMAGRLILQNSKKVLELWEREPEARLKLAVQNWPRIVEREGKPLP